MNKGKKIYVGNIPFHVADVHLKDAFAPFGEVYEVHIVSDRDTGRPRGFAFVTMDEAGAQKAIDALHETDFGGRTMVVNEAREREQRGGGKSRGGHDRGERRSYDR